jgi:hypothetical protein
VTSARAGEAVAASSAAANRIGTDVRLMRASLTPLAP